MRSLFNSISLKGGFYATGCVVAFSVLSLIFGLYDRINSFRFIDLMVYLISVGVFVFLSIRTFKKASGGYLTISQSIKTGLQIALVAAISFILYNFIFINVLKPDYYDNIYYGPFSERTRAHFESFRDRESRQESYDSYAAGAFKREYTHNYPMLLFLTLSLGLLISLISGLIMKSKPQITHHHDYQ